MPSAKGWMMAKNAKPVSTAVERVAALLKAGIPAAQLSACCSECALAVKTVVRKQKGSATRSKKASKA